MTKATAIAIALLSASLLACNEVQQSYAPGPDAHTETGWTEISAGTNNLNAIHGVSDKALWVVGDNGTIGRWDGTKLTWENSGTKVNLRGVWALGPEDAYAVGDGGTVLERNAAGWHTVAAKITREVLTAVWADSKRVVAVGSNATVLLSGGAAGYQLLTNTACAGKPCAENLFGVTGVPGGVITAVGALGLVLTITGTAIARVSITNFTKLLSGVASGPGTTYLVGQQGTVFQGLTPVLGCPSAELRAVSTVGAEVWIVGWDGAVCKVAAGKTTSYPYTDTRWFNGVYAASVSDVWVVGASGTLLHGIPLPPEAGP